MGEGLGSLPKTQRFVYGSGWVVCGGWCSARLLGGMRGLVFRPGFLRLMLPETHTTQPTLVDGTLNPYHPTCSLSQAGSLEG